MNNRSQNDTGLTHVTSEDADTWERFTQTVKPLRRAHHHNQSPVAPSPDPCDTYSSTTVSQNPDHLSESFSATPGEDSPRAKIRAKIQSQDFNNPGLPPLVMGATPGLDRRAAARLRRGQWPIEATLDLHGYRRDTAQEATEAFISQSASQGLRCVQVITGKGVAGDIETGWRGQGVLRAGLADWLNRPSVRPLILAYNQAQPRDGGGGAFYILLRRRR